MLLKGFIFIIIVALGLYFIIDSGIVTIDQIESYINKGLQFFKDLYYSLKSTETQT